MRRLSWPIRVAILALLCMNLAPASSGAAAESDLGVVFTRPISGAIISDSGSGVAVQFEGFGGSDPDGNGIVVRRFVLDIGGTTVADSTGTFPYNHQEAGYFWETTTYADGPHLFEVTVTDEVGHTASASAVFNLLNHPSGAGNADGSSLTASVLTSPASGPFSGELAVGVRADHAAAGASATLTLAIDGVEFDSMTTSCTDGTCIGSWIWDTTTVPDGAHTLTGTVEGSTGGSASHTITVQVANGPGGGGPQPVVWTSPVKVTVDGNSITKNAGCDGCADAGAISQQTIASGNGFVEFKVSPNAYLTVGLSTGNPGTSGSEIKFGLRFFPGFAVQVRESGVLKAGWTSVVGALYKIAVEGGAVKYYENGTLKYTSAQAPTYPLLVDTSLLTLSAGVQNAMISTAGGGGTPPDPTPPTVTITVPANDATVSGMITVSATASDNVGVTGVQFQLDGVNLGAEDTTTPYSVAWDTTTATNGPHTLTAVAKDAAGNTTASEPITVTVSNDTPPPGPGPQPVVWTSAVRVAVSGNTITKNAGCGGCADAGAISEQMITSGIGFVEFTVSSGATLTAGLSNGNPGTSGSEIDFGLRFYPGSPGIVEVRESGVYKWDFQHVAGAVYKVALEAGVVKYSQNGALKYTSAQAPSSPLLLDASLLTIGSAVQNAVIGTGP